LHRQSTRTEFGEAVAKFSFEKNIPMTIIAAKSGVSYESMRSVMYGRIPGHELVPKVKAFMKSHKPD
jgi:hypothetical protein